MAVISLKILNPFLNNCVSDIYGMSAERVMHLGENNPLTFNSYHHIATFNSYHHIATL